MIATYLLEHLRDTIRNGGDVEPGTLDTAAAAADELLAIRRADSEHYYHPGADAAVRWFRRIAGADPALAFTHDEVPLAKGRPRVGKGHAFTPGRTRAAEQGLAWRFRLAMRNAKPLEGNLGIACVFYRPDRRRIDGDNMLKLVCDAGNLARVWGDDCQLTTKLVRIELDADRPRTEIAIGSVASTLTR